MKIIKNFCEKDKFEEIQKIILGSNFPFYFSDGVADFEQLYDIFDDLEFQSMLKEKTWNKYINTFKELVECI